MHQIRFKKPALNFISSEEIEHEAEEVSFQACLTNFRRDGMIEESNFKTALKEMQRSVKEKSAD